MQPKWGNLVLLPLPFPSSTAALTSSCLPLHPSLPTPNFGSRGVGSQEDVSLWTGGMFFLLCIVLPVPIVWAESRTSPSRLANFQQSWGTFPEGTDPL